MSVMALVAAIASAAAPAEVHAGPVEVHAGPAEVHAAPAEVHAGPAEVHAGPAEVHAGPAEVHAGRADSVATAADVRPDRRLYVGMGTIHLRDLKRGVDNNWVLGLSWGRVYGATFINSFGNRGYSAGIQGSFASWDPGVVRLGVGYRAGLVTGYDERFIRLAGKTPVLPLVQPLVRVDGRRLGVEFSYSGVIASGALNVRF